MNKKKKYIIICIIAIILVSIVGTFAWLTAKTKKSSLVLVLGEFDSLQVTLSPYELNIIADPTQNYTALTNYVSVTAKNNKKDTSDRFGLFYQIESIDQELASSSMKYTITKSTNNSTFNHLVTGTFAGTTSNQDLTILEETIPANTTYYYRIYTYLADNGQNQSNMQGKRISAAISADIAA